MWRLLKNWDRKLEDVVNEIDRVVEQATPVTPKENTPEPLQTRRVT